MSGGTALVGGFLLFWLELLTGRRLLPLLGGSALVWSTCLAFFQTALLAGYALAQLTGRFTRRHQAAVHTGLAVLALLTLDLTPPPLDRSPLPWLLLALVKTTALPFVVLATTTSLLTAWSETGEPSSIFASSNKGSILALLAYPLLIEPQCGLDDQTTLWRAGFALYTIALAASAPWHQLVKIPHPIETDPPLFKDWILLSAVPSALLTALTTHMTQEIPAGPYLWALLLLVYLISFVLAYSPSVASWIELALTVEPLLLAIAVTVLFVPMRLGGFCLHLVALFGICLSLHGRLALLAPERDRGAYLLSIAAGGALGGLFSALVAPRAFTWVAEYPLALLAAAALRPSPADLDDRLPQAPATPTDLFVPLGIGSALAALLAALPHRGDEWDGVARIGLLLQAAAIAFLARRRPGRFTLCLLAILTCGYLYLRPGGELFAARSPYGVCRVVKKAKTLLLFHGTTIHGGRDAAGRPMAYHSTESPLGRLLRTTARPHTPVAVLGLGAGAVAWYTHLGYAIRFYELDPLVYQVAADPRYFGFLPPHADVILGDGRLSISREKPSTFLMIVLDAFGSDAVPVHLVTREAFSTYLRVLVPDGLLITNITNRHVDLAPVLADHTRALGLTARCARGADALGTWVALARSASVLDRATSGDPRWRALTATGVRWTDDHTPLLPLLHW